MLVNVLLLCGCARYLPVPGGTDTVNKSYYTTREDLLARLNALTPGTSEQAVFETLGHQPDDFLKLERNQIVDALYGTSNVAFNDGSPAREDHTYFLQSLYGYRLNYKIVKRRHGFTSPIRIETDESGFDYAVALIFRDGILYTAPVVTGGTVNRSSTKTFFDYLNPGTILDHAE